MEKNSENRQTWLFNEKGSVLVSKETGDDIKVMKNKTNPLTRLFKENPFYFAAFFLPAVILFVSYVLFGVYPFGNRSVLALDLNGQYVYYFDYMKDVFTGHESLFYSWSRSLSGEFIGTFGYYLASPFNLLVWLFPREYITEGILTMLIAKVGTIGVTMAVYLRRGRGYSAGTATVFSMMYALCAYTVVQTMNPMWLDGVLILPLIIYGVESLVKYGRFRLLTLSLFYSFVTCFYIGYMLGIFTALYFICCLVSSRCSERGNQSSDGGAVMARIGLFAISAATAILMASFILIPVYSSLQLGKRDFTQPFRTAGGELNTEFFGQTNFMLADFARKVFPNSYDTVRNDSLPAVYSGTLVLLLLPLFFFAGKEKVISVKRRAAGAILALFLILSMYYTPIDTFMHGMQVPNWLPYRYSFILSFLFTAWAAEVFDKLREFSRRTIGLSALGIFGLLVCFESRDTFNSSLGDGGRELFDNATVVIPALLILAVLTVILLCNKNKKFGKTALTVTIGAVVALELFYSTYSGIKKQDEDITYSDRASYTDFILPLREVVNEIKESDDGFYRIEKDFHRTVNDPLALGMYGLSHSSSTFHEGAVTLLGRLGMTSKGHYTRYSGTTLTDDLFGVRYILSHSGYSYDRPLSSGILSIRHNDNALPIAYLTDTRLATLNFDDYPADDTHIFRRQNRLLSAMTGEPKVVEYIRSIEPENIEKTTENVIEGGTTDGHTAYTASGENAKVIYSITAEADGNIFMWLPTAHERRAGVLVERRNEEGAVVRSDRRGSYFEYDDYCIMNLGEFKAGEYFSVTLALQRDDLYYKSAYFAYMDGELYGGAIDSLHALNSQTAVTKRSGTDLRIDVFTDTERLLFTTIPAEPGWTATVDGREVEYVKVMGALIGIMLPAGAHVIELKFTPAGYPVALFLTGGGLIIFIVLCVLYSKLNKTRGGGKWAMESGQLTADNEQLTIDSYEEHEEFDYKIANIGEPQDESAVKDFMLMTEAEPMTEPVPEPDIDDFEFVPEPPLTEKSFFAGEEDDDEEQEEIILGSDESFESIAADFARINEEAETEEEPAPFAGDIDGSVTLPEEDIKIDDGFLLVPEVEMSPQSEAEPDIELDDLVPPEIDMDSDNEPDIKLDDLSAPEFNFEPAAEPLAEATPEEDNNRTASDIYDEIENKEPAPPSALGQIDFAARRKALELEMMNERQTLEQSFFGDISDAYEEEYEAAEIIPAEDEQPVVPESQAEPLFTFEEDVEDLLVSNNAYSVPSDGLFDGEDEEQLPSAPAGDAVSGAAPPALHTSPPQSFHDDVFEEFEFIAEEEAEFVGTFDEARAEADGPSAAQQAPEEEPPPFEEEFRPPFGPGTL